MRARIANAAFGILLALLIAACQPAEERPSADPAAAAEPGEELLEVIERHGPEFLDIPYVVTAGEDSVDGRPVIVIFVEKGRLTPELVAQLPREIEGYAVVVRENEQ